MIDLEAIGNDLVAAHARRTQVARRRRRTARSFLVAGAAAAVLAAAAAASDGAFNLDPTQWTILGGGSTDGGRGAYVHAERKADGSPSTFMVEHTDGLTPYAAFLLHERTRAAADTTSPVPVATEAGALCTPAELTRAESIALHDGADGVRAAFAGSPCRGLEYAVEQAQLVRSGVEPPALLMPGAK